MSLGKMCDPDSHCFGLNEASIRYALTLLEAALNGCGQPMASRGSHDCVYTGYLGDGIHLIEVILPSQSTRNSLVETKHVCGFTRLTQDVDQGGLCIEPKLSPSFVHHSNMLLISTACIFVKGYEGQQLYIPVAKPRVDLASNGPIASSIVVPTRMERLSDSTRVLPPLNRSALSSDPASSVGEQSLSLDSESTDFASCVEALSRRPSATNGPDFALATADKNVGDAQRMH